MVRALWFCLAFGSIAAQDIMDRVQLMEDAKTAFLAGHYQETVDLLRPVLGEEAGAAHLLAADALFALQTEDALAEAKLLYERCLYENPDAPFDDHSYFQLSRIYQTESAAARENDDLFTANELEEEARFYLGQLLRKYPDSYYREASRQALFELAAANRDFEQAAEQARAIGAESEEPDLLARVEPFLAVERGADAAALAAIYDQREATIRQFPELMAAYAAEFERVGDLERAAAVHLDILNLWPQREDGAESLLRLAELERQAQRWDAARFLFVQAMERRPNALIEARAALALAEMMMAGRVATVEIAKQPWRYDELVDLIRHSPLDPAVRARYSYRVALYEAAVGNEEKALVVLQNLRADYDRGPFLGLYRDFYQKLLFTVIDRKFDSGDDWGLDRVYRRHRAYLDATPQTAYPEKAARAYLRLGLPASAIQVYEGMWAYKLSIAGFELAYERPLTDSLELLDAMRDEDRLAVRLRDYAVIYPPGGREYDRYLLVKARHESRTLSPEDYLENVKSGSLAVDSAHDAQRLRLAALIAQETEDADLAEKLYAAAQQWPALAERAPEVWREARLFDADRLYALGNYHEAERRYAAIRRDDSFTDSDRDWAFLQIARLRELAGELKPSLRMYGQIAYAEDMTSTPWRAFAERRMAALATARRLDGLAEELRRVGR